MWMSRERCKGFGLLLLFLWLYVIFVCIKCVIEVGVLFGITIERGFLVTDRIQYVSVEYRLFRFFVRGFQFGWQSGDQLVNWTGFFNVTDDLGVQSGSDFSSFRYRFRRMIREGGSLFWGDFVVFVSWFIFRVVFREEVGFLQWFRIYCILGFYLLFLI